MISFLSLSTHNQSGVRRKCVASLANRNTADSNRYARNDWAFACLRLCFKERDTHKWVAVEEEEDEEAKRRGKKIKSKIERLIKWTHTWTDLL